MILDNNLPFFTIQTKRGLQSWESHSEHEHQVIFRVLTNRPGKISRRILSVPFGDLFTMDLSRNPWMFLSWGKSPVVFLLGLSGAPRQNPQGVFHTAIPPSYITVGSTNGRFSKTVMEGWKEMVVFTWPKLQKWSTSEMTRNFTKHDMNGVFHVDPIDPIWQTWWARNDIVGPLLTDGFWERHLFRKTVGAFF